MNQNKTNGVQDQPLLQTEGPGPAPDLSWIPATPNLNDDDIQLVDMFCDKLYDEYARGQNGALQPFLDQEGSRIGAAMPLFEEAEAAIRRIGESRNPVEPAIDDLRNKWKSR